MNGIRTTVAFLLGAVVGGTVVWYSLKETYANQAEQDISSAKEAFHIREEKLNAEIEKLREQSEPKDEPKTVLANEKTPDKGDIMDVARGKYHQYNPAPVAQQLPKSNVEPEQKANSIEAPYVISPNEFGELDGYSTVSLTYYADDVLADENGIVIDNVGEIVGDALNHFGEYEEDSVFCRSDSRRCDYEILQDLRRYEDIRNTFPPNR